LTQRKAAASTAVETRRIALPEPPAVSSRILVIQRRPRTPGLRPAERQRRRDTLGALGRCRA
jgi:hypothetical protein